MFKKIAAVQPLSHGELIVWFVDGEARLLETNALFAEGEGLGELEDIQKLYVAHAQAAIDSLQ